VNEALDHRFPPFALTTNSASFIIRRHRPQVTLPSLEVTARAILCVILTLPQTGRPSSLHLTDESCPSIAI